MVSNFPSSPAVKYLPAMQETPGQFLGRNRSTSLVGSVGKESACTVGDLGLISGLGKSPGDGNDNPLQYPCLKNPHGQRSLAGSSLWGHKESDTTDHLSTQSSETFFSFPSKYSLWFFSMTHMTLISPWNIAEILDSFALLTSSEPHIHVSSGLMRLSNWKTFPNQHVWVEPSWALPSCLQSQWILLPT